MKTHHFLLKGDMFLGVAAFCVVIGLMYIGLQSLANESTHTIFRQKQKKTFSR